MKLSIIIPVYNVEIYIENCIQSLLCQDLDEDDYQLIIINDGSPDNSENIIKKYSAIARNIVYIKQENAGVSVARNRGLEVAKGKYILFVDPDDSIRENTLSAVLAQAEKLELEIMYLRMDGYDENGKFVTEYPPCGEDNVIAEGFAHDRRTFPSTLYLRGVIGDIRFIPDVKRGQDTVFNVMVHSLAQRVSYFSLPYYKYLHRVDSSKQYVATDGVFHGCITAITEISKFQQKYFFEGNDTQKKYFDNAIKIFVERIFQWSVIPTLHYKRFVQTREKVIELRRKYIIDELSVKYRFINRNYLIFYTFHSLYRIKRYFKTL